MLIPEIGALCDIYITFFIELQYKNTVIVCNISNYCQVWYTLSYEERVREVASRSQREELSEH